MEWSDLQAIYDELGTFAKIAEAFGCSMHKVQNEMRKRGIKPKQRGWPKGAKMNAAWHDAHQAALAKPEIKQKYRENLLKRLPFMSGPSANSPLERLLHKGLAKAGISFKTQRRKLDKYVVDIEIIQAPVIIEADGALHHLHKDRDAIRDAELEKIGYRVFRFCGKEINTDPDGCIRRVIEACGLKQDEEPVFDIRNGVTGKDNHFWRGGKAELVCEECGSTFFQYKSNRKSKRKFCRAACYHAWQRKHPEAMSSRWNHKMKA